MEEFGVLAEEVGRGGKWSTRLSGHLAYHIRY